jgi:hypothetical protein
VGGVQLCFTFVDVHTQTGAAETLCGRVCGLGFVRALCCCGHWATQCKSAFEAPMDPHVILGGFSTGPDFRYVLRVIWSHLFTQQ